MADGIHEDTAPEVCDALDSTPPMHGPVDVFNEKQLVNYNQMIVDSLDVTFSKKQRRTKRSNAANKLKKAISKRMEDDGDADAKAANDKRLEKERVRFSLSNADAKGKRDAGDQDAIAKHDIGSKQDKDRHASNKVARLAGDKKHLAAHVAKSEYDSIRYEAKRQERDSNRDMVEVDDEEYMGTKQFFEHDVWW